MWLLIEVDDLMDAGKNEKQRIIFRDNSIDIKENQLGWIIVAGKGQHFHPMTKDED